jgi:hypothetical protein
MTAREVYRLAQDLKKRFLKNLKSTLKIFHEMPLIRARKIQIFFIEVLDELRPFIDKKVIFSENKNVRRSAVRNINLLRPHP